MEATLQATLLALFNIVIIDLVLSGDNAVVIGMAVHRLEGRQKRIAILAGGGLALLLRVTLTALATFLLQIPLLQAVGALVLVWITYRLVSEDATGPHVDAQANAGFLAAMRTIIIADVTMSTDNVLAVGAAAHGDFLLLLFGLGLSMAILVAGGTLVSMLITRMAWLTYVGAAVLVVLSGQMLSEDHWLIDHGFLPPHEEAPLLPWIFSLVIGLVLVGLLFWRRSRQTRHESGSHDAQGTAV